MITVIQGEIWGIFNKEENLDKWIVITTNGFVKKNMECVMGRGIAKQASQRFPKLPLELGQNIILDGNCLFVFPEYRIITFPVKTHWIDKANLAVVSESFEGLNEFINSELRKEKEPIIYTTKVGCGNGKEKWSNIQPIMEKYMSSLEKYIKVVDICLN